MDHIAKATTALTAPSASSLPSLTNPSAEQVDLARVVASRILKNYPDYGKASADYAVSFTECLAYLTTEELAWVSNPRDGIHTTSKYLPTAADVHEFIRGKRAIKDKFKAFGGPAPQPKEAPEPELTKADIERRKRIVRETLGYDPLDKYKTVKRELTEATKEDLDSITLKTPAKPVSEELKRLLWEQGYFRASESDAA